MVTFVVADSCQTSLAFRQRTNHNSEWCIGPIADPGSRSWVVLRAEPGAA
jgi:hypothetical protein